MIEKLFYTYEEPTYEEIFKVITYPKIKKEKYLISNHGRVFNLKTKKIMKTYFDKDDYERITLVTDKKNSKRRGNISKHFFIHRLMAWEFIGPPTDDKQIVNHLNAIPCCNFIHNLEWTDVLGNTNHAKEIGLMKNDGINSSSCKYDEKIIRKICSMLEDGRTSGQIFKKLKNNKKFKSKYALYSLINKLMRKTSYIEICNEYNYEVSPDFYKCDEETQTIRDMIVDGKNNFQILEKFGYSSVSQNKTFYNKIIRERAKCKMLFND